ncbi:helix-turn-helix domain-containing protein [Streptomyces sp. 5-10]|uniref:helix-turn-helix domain-containing protein n=1 Tax=Streptomyces sp. 5-10 TaxID=878925 RepID=UPI00168B7430|nr:helix-turn-helix domain-containing protein [Streptomyces sp. 5-10]MBD3004529.1 hypothetical protein [Streptomyces sp. 5-10]
MSFEYIDAAMKATGLSASQKAVLLNYCIRADAHGYSWPGRKRIADDTGLSLRSVNYAKTALIEMNLIANKERTDANKRQITDLVRVNLAGVKAIARKAKDYKDNLVEEITFARQEEPQVTRGATTAPSPGEGVQELHPGGATTAPSPCTPCTPEGATSAPLESPQQPPRESSTEPSSLSPYPSREGAGSDAGPEGPDERDAASPHNPAGVRSAADPGSDEGGSFPGEVTEVVTTAAIEVGVDPGEALDVLSAWDRLSFRYFGERGTLEELLNEGPVIVEQLNLGRSAEEIKRKLEGDFREAASEAA